MKLNPNWISNEADIDGEAIKWGINSVGGHTYLIGLY